MFVDARTQRPDGVAHGALGAADDLVGERLQAGEVELLHELDQALASDGAFRDLRVEVSQHHVRQPGVLAG